MVTNRDFPRKLVQIPVVLGVRNREKSTRILFKERGIITDIGVGGVYILKSPPFPKTEIIDLFYKKSKLMVEFFLPHTDIPIIATGRVRWVEDNTRFFPAVSGIGVEFDDISREDVLEIIKFISGEKKVIKKEKKREFLRAQTSIPIVLKRGVTSHAIDISVGGLGLSTTPSLKRRHLFSLSRKDLKIKLRLLKKKIEFTGRIRWKENMKDNSTSMSKLGIEFTEISDNDRKTIAKYVVNQRKKESEVTVSTPRVKLMNASLN